MKVHVNTIYFQVLGSAPEKFQQQQKFYKTNRNNNGLFQKKYTPPRRMANWKFQQEGGLMAWEIRAGRGIWT